MWRVFGPTLLVASILFAAIVLGLIAVSGCARIDGTVAYRPPAFHEGYEQYSCWAVSESGEDACCWYFRGDTWQLVCTRDGGDTWDLMHEPRGQIELPTCPADWRYSYDEECETA